MSRGKIRKKGSHIRHAETLQIMPPAVPIWAVYELKDGTCCVDRVHAWGLEQIAIDGLNKTTTSVAAYVIDWTGALTPADDANNFAGIVEADSEEEAVRKGQAMVTSNAS